MGIDIRKYTNFIRSSGRFFAKQNGNYNDYNTWNIEGKDGVLYPSPGWFPTINNPVITTGFTVTLTQNELALSLAGTIVFNGFTLTFSYDSDTTAYISTFGTTPSIALIQAIDEFIIGCKTDRSNNPANTSNWQENNLIRLYCNETQQAARINMKNPAFAVLTEVNTPGWIAKYAYTTDGVSQYLNQNWNELTHGGTTYVANSAGCTLVSLTEVIQANPQVTFGATDTGFNGATSQIRTSGNLIMSAINCALAPQISNPTSIGTFTFSKTASGTLLTYRDGVLIGTQTGITDTALASGNHYTGCRNSNGTAAGFTQGAFAFEAKHSGFVNASKFFVRVDALIYKIRSLS